MGNEEFKLPPTPPEGKLTLGTTGKHPIQGPPTLPQCQPSLSETAPPLLVTVSIPIPPGKASQRPIQQPEHQISLLPEDHQHSASAQTAYPQASLFSSPFLNPYLWWKPHCYIKDQIL